MDRILLFPELSFKLVGLLFKVHNELGFYSNEKHYGDRLEELLMQSEMPYIREWIIKLDGGTGRHLRHKVDFLIDNRIILELKAARIITKDDYYQVQRYLHASNMELGILVNFHNRYLSPKRILNSNASPD